jgi:hypothetical protein
VDEICDGLDLTRSQMLLVVPFDNLVIFPHIIWQETENKGQFWGPVSITLTDNTVFDGMGDRRVSEAHVLISN